MLYGEINKQKLQKAKSLFLNAGEEKHELEIPKYRLGKVPMPGDVAKSLIESLLLDEGNSRMNMATFCQTHMERHAQELKDAKYGDGTPVVWNLYDLADRLQMHGWQVPAYPLPQGAEDVTVQRIVCRADLTHTLTEAFVNDFQQCLDDLKHAHVLCNEQKSGKYGFTY